MATVRELATEIIDEEYHDRIDFRTYEDLEAYDLVDISRVSGPPDVDALFEARRAIAEDWAMGTVVIEGTVEEYAILFSEEEAEEFNKAVPPKIKELEAKSDAFFPWVDWVLNDGDHLEEYEEDLKGELLFAGASAEETESILDFIWDNTCHYYRAKDALESYRYRCEGEEV